MTPRRRPQRLPPRRRGWAWLALAAVTVAWAAVPARAQVSAAQERQWNEPVEPFRIAGNLYYVGAREVASYLVVTPAGLIVIDSGFEETVPEVLANIATLGFHAADVKLLLATHAHYDHVGGMASLRARTGARLLMSSADAALAARGGKADPNFGDRFRYAPFTPDGTITDGERVELGGATLVAHLTAGHTPGCTTWTLDVVEHGRPLHVLVLCSVTAPGYELVGNRAYPRIADDFEATFARLAAMPADVLLASHGSVFHLLDKRAELCRNPEHNPFVDREEFPRYLAQARAAFEKQLAAQREKARAGASAPAGRATGGEAHGPREHRSHHR